MACMLCDIHIFSQVCAFHMFSGRCVISMKRCCFPWEEGRTPLWDKKGEMQNRQLLSKVTQLLRQWEQYQEDQKARQEWIVKVRRRLKEKAEKQPKDEQQARWEAFCSSNAG